MRRQQFIFAACAFIQKYADIKAVILLPDCLPADFRQRAYW